MIEVLRRSSSYIGYMEKMRVLVANDPCLYREAITDALRELRPHLVVCSQISAAVHALLAWIMLYPDGENRAVINTAGEQVTVNEVGFGDILSIIDRTELLLSELLS
jgi:hypothetical protein